MRILLWHVHGSWTTAFVQGDHEYVVPLVPDRGPDGRGRADTYEWPASVIEATPEELRELDGDVVVLQRPHELLYVDVPCAGCRARDCPVPGHPCLEGVRTNAVVMAVERFAADRSRTVAA